MKTLHLTLKKQWFDMTKSGIKTEDYRDVNKYWFKRLIFKWRDVMLFHGYNDLTDEIAIYIIENSKMYGFKPFKSNIMTLGYAKKGDKERTLELEHKGIEVGTGNPEWGAEPNKMYFVVKHGKTINTDLQEAIKKAKPNLDKIKDVDKHLDEIRNSRIKTI